MNFEEIKNALQDAYSRYTHFGDDLAVTLTTEKMPYGEILEMNFKWYVGDKVASLEYAIEENELKCRHYINDEDDNAVFTNITLEEFLQGVHKEFYNRGVEFIV